MITNIGTASRFIALSKYREEHGENVTVALSPEAEIILQWASARMKEEQRIKQLAETNPAVADAANAVKRAEEQLRVVMELVQ